MTLSARLLIIGVASIFLLVVLGMVRRRSLGLEYSILWLLLTGLAVVAGLVQKQADAISRWIGIDYPPAFFLLLCVVVLLAIVLHLTVRLARLTDAFRALAQEIALLKAGGDASQQPPRGESNGKEH